VSHGGAQHVIAVSAAAAKFDRVDDAVTRIAVGEPVDGWRDFGAAYQGDGGFTPDGVTRASDTLLLYFTSRGAAACSWRSPRRSNRATPAGAARPSWPQGRFAYPFRTDFSTRDRPPTLKSCELIARILCLHPSGIRTGSFRAGCTRCR